jgi:hypothetical protein
VNEHAMYFKCRYMWPFLILKFPSPSLLHAAQPFSKSQYSVSSSAN